MSQVKSELIRNLAIVGHGDAGKTSFVSAMLYSSGQTKRLLSVNEGNTITDFDEDEIKRKISISTALCSTTWKKHKINIMDTPGYTDFLCDAFPALQNSDIAAFVINGTAGIECNLERIWDTENTIPPSRVFLINKLDRENSSFNNILQTLKDKFSMRITPIALPIGKEAGFKGLVDLINQKTVQYDSSGSGKYTTSDIPDELKDEVDEARIALIEAVAESDDELLEKYLEGEDISSEEILKGLKSAVLSGDMYPAIPISSLANIGVTYFMDFCVDYLPSPVDVPAREIDGSTIKCEASDPFVAQIFKSIIDPYTGKLSIFRVYSGTGKIDSQIKNSSQNESGKLTGLSFIQGKTLNTTTEVVAGDIAAISKLKKGKAGDTLCAPDKSLTFPSIEYPSPLFSLAFVPKSKTDEEKISTSLTRLAEEDPTLRYTRNSETNQLIVSGMGQLHLEVTQNRLKQKYGVSASTEAPKVPYRETIKGTADVRYRHKKQSGGAGQFGEVAIRLLPLPDGEGFEFDNQITGGVIPGQYIPSVEKGIVNIMADGIIAKYPVTNIKVELYDGKTHPVDSKDIAFQIAGAMALRQAFSQAQPILLEPIMKVKIIVPEIHMGDIMGDLSSRRGKVTGMDSKGTKQVINGLVPMSEMLIFEPELRSMSGGRGSFSMEFDHYAELPPQFAEKIIQEANKE